MFAHAAGQQAGDDGDDEKHQQRENLLRLRDRKIIERLDEKKIEGEKGEQRPPRSPTTSRSASAQKITATRKIIDRFGKCSQCSSNKPAPTAAATESAAAPTPPASDSGEGGADPRLSGGGALSSVTICTAISRERRTNSWVKDRRSRLAKKPDARAAQDDLREILAARETQQLPREIAGGKPLRRGAKTLGQAQRVVDAFHARDIRLLLAGPLDENRGPFRVEGGRETRAGAHDAIGGKIRADADQQSFGGRPRAFDRVLAEIIDHLIVDALGGAAQGEFAQRREIAGREKILRRELGRLGNIDLPLVEALEEFVRRDVDENDIGRPRRARGRARSRARARR